LFSSYLLHGVWAVTGHEAYSILKADEEERERGMFVVFGGGRKKKTQNSVSNVIHIRPKRSHAGYVACDTETTNHLEGAFVRAGASMA
jgi:hypothetical protein